MHNPAKNVLLIEDTLSHQDLMKIAFENCNSPHQLDIVSDGEEALDYLLQRYPYQDSPRPDLIFLDLDLPKIDGYQLLSIIKNNDLLKSIPVIVFTTSNSQLDILQSYKLKANCYLCKPYQLEDFFAVIKTSLNFWLDFCLLP